ncbi:hypothetical protein Tco_0726521 [Tanacetum coccineum]|uniref:Tf2-1-like SH3-like domain-containing protein n=1 Tax=Tanacetum coccineum TaxID=301880 RepID=A0ABQ4YGR3_9ASTR
MNRLLFTRIVRDVSDNCPYFKEGCDVVGKAGISVLVKCTFTIRQLAYATVPDSLDEYLQIGEKTSRDCLMHLCNGVIELYGEEVLAKVGKVTYRLELPQELSRVHHTFHVSNLKKCYADEPLVMSLEGIHVDDKLQLWKYAR